MPLSEREIQQVRKELDRARRILSDREIQSVRLELTSAVIILQDAIAKAERARKEIDRICYVIAAWANTLHREPKKRKRKR